jgi:TonB family protein
MRRLALFLLALAAMPLFAQDAAAPLRVGGDVKAPTIISRVDPVYPPVARKARISGIVIVEVVIDRNGDVGDVKVLKPLPFGLDQAAVDAVKQWKFSPATLNGQPVDVIFNLTVNFKPDGVEGETPPPMMPPARAPLTTVILVRHAEKAAAPANDPALTAAGRQRAQNLARMLANAGVTAIYTTPYTRTRDTVAPLASAVHVQPVEMAVSDTYARDVVQKVHEQHGGTIVVAGHSNTTPDVLRALGVLDVKEIADSEYDNLYIVTLGPFAVPRLLSLKY